MIKPVNGHLLIDPIKHEGFMASQRETYEEVGVVLAFAESVELEMLKKLKIGDKVYFDSWIAAKYPKEGGSPDDYYWLVKWADVRAVEYVKPTVSE